MLLILSLNALITIIIITSISYLKEKGKNYATKEDVGKITEIVEKTKASFELEKHKLNSALSSQSASYHAADNKRVEAVEKTWISFTDIGNVTVKEHFLYLDILLETEFVSLLGKKDATETLTVDLDKMNKDSVIVDALRPFINEALYSIYFTFRAIRGRTGFLLINSIETRKAISWSRDAFMLKLMKNILSDQEVEAIHKAPLGKWGLLRLFFYNKALSEMNKILSGQAALESSVENARRALEMAIVSEAEFTKEGMK